MNAWGLIVWGLALVAQDPAVPVTTEADADAAIAEFKRNYYRPGSTEDELVLAVRTLGETVHAKTLAVLVPLVYDGRGPVSTRIASALVLAKFGKIEGTPEALIRAYAFTDTKPANRPVRIQILQTLGELKAESAVAMINASIFDRDPWVARAAAKAAGRIRGMYSIPYLIEKLQRVDKSTAGSPEPSKDGRDHGDALERHLKTERQVLEKALHEALQDITRLRHNCGYTWRKWWDGQKDGYKVPK